MVGIKVECVLQKLIGWTRSLKIHISLAFGVEPMSIIRTNDVLRAL